MESFRDHLIFLQKKSLEIRIETLKMIHQAGVGHTGSCLSAIDILTTLYFGKLHDQAIMNIHPENPDWQEQDYFILSKSQACPAWYTVLANVGFFLKEELEYFGQSGSLLQVHPIKKIPGVSIGSSFPGQGLSTALGLALGLKLDKQPNRVFCLLGDGELQNGQIWETALAAAHYKLDNLIAIVDLNHLQLDAPTHSIINVDPIADKFDAFGWKTIPVYNGHDFEDLLYAFERSFEVHRRPTVIIARTIKGKGVGFAENKVSYNSPFSEQEMAEAIPQLENELEALMQNIEG